MFESRKVRLLREENSALKSCNMALAAAAANAKALADAQPRCVGESCRHRRAGTSAGEAIGSLADKLLAQYENLFAYSGEPQMREGAGDE